MHGLESLCHEAGNGGNNGRLRPKQARAVFLSRQPRKSAHAEVANSMGIAWRRPGHHAGKAVALWEETGACTTGAAVVGV